MPSVPERRDLNRLRTMVDRSLRLTFRNFSTLFLLALVVFGPLYVGYNFYFRDVITVREIHDVIRTFPGKRQVGGVGRAELDLARSVSLAALALSLVALPLLARHARRIFERDAAGEAPTVTDALRNSPSSKSSLRTAVTQGLPATVAGVLVGLGVWWLTQRIGSGLSEFLPEDQAWTVVGASEAISRAAGAAFVIGAIASAVIYRPENRSSSGDSVSTVDSTNV